MSIDANAQGCAWTSQSVIAERAECRRQTVNRWFGKLEAAGLIATRPRGHNKSKEFVLCFREDLAWHDGTPVTPGGQGVSAQSGQGMSVSRTPPERTGYVTHSGQGYVTPGVTGAVIPERTRREIEEKEEETLKTDSARARPTASATATIEQENDDDAQDLLEAYVEEMGKRGICRPEWYEADIGKADWRAAFQEGVTMYGLATLVEALQRLLDCLDDPDGYNTTEDWQRVLSGRRSAITFIRRVDQLLRLSPTAEVVWDKWGWQR